MLKILEQLRGSGDMNPMEPSQEKEETELIKNINTVTPHFSGPLEVAHSIEELNRQTDRIKYMFFHTKRA